MDKTTADKVFSGGVNAVATAAKAAGKTVEEFMKLIGRGDLAAFGAVIADIGEVYRQANLGNTGSTIGAGFGALGNTLTAFGKARKDNGLVIAGTALAGIGNVLLAANGGTAEGVRSAAFGAAGSLATALGQMSLNPEDGKVLLAAGTLLSGAPQIFDVFKPGVNPNLAWSAVTDIGSRALGTLIGGKQGEFAANLGALVSTGFQIQANAVQGGAGTLYVTAARQLLGRPVAVLRERGQWLNRADGLPVLVTLHPSALLRMDAAEREAAYMAWLTDLDLASRHAAPAAAL